VSERFRCECRHLPDEHVGKTGHCQGLDSYECPCACPSYDELYDYDEAHEELYDYDER
jgi:hypothetical protein